MFTMPHICCTSLHCPTPFLPTQVDRVTVTPNFDTIAVGFEDPLTQAELEDHIGDSSNIEWAHVMQMFFASTDPRGQERQLGTLGGDLGSFFPLWMKVFHHDCCTQSPLHQTSVIIILYYILSPIFVCNQ
jgi:hypothetical protein